MPTWNEMKPKQKTLKGDEAGYPSCKEGTAVQVKQISSCFIIAQLTTQAAEWKSIKM